MTIMVWKILDHVCGVITVLTNEDRCAESLSHREFTWHSPARRLAAQISYHGHDCCRGKNGRNCASSRTRQSAEAFLGRNRKSHGCGERGLVRVGVHNSRWTQWPVKATTFI